MMVRSVNGMGDAVVDESPPPPQPFTLIVRPNGPADAAMPPSHFRNARRDGSSAGKLRHFKFDLQANGSKLISFDCNRNASYSHLYKKSSLSMHLL